MNMLLEWFLSGINEVWYYMTNHVLTCLLPAFFVAGGIAMFLSKNAVLKYFGAQTKKYISYTIGSVSGILLAVCSCTIIPLFAGIYKRGAGLGPAITFLYSGPAINLLAITLTSTVLGWQMGLARIIGAIIFAIIIGLIMSLIFPETQKQDNNMFAGEDEEKSKGAVLGFFALLIAILLFGTLDYSFVSETALATVFSGGELGLTNTPFAELIVKYSILLVLIAAVYVVVKKHFSSDERAGWISETFSLIKLIFPMLLLGVFVAGVVKVAIPEEVITRLVGGNSISANFLAAIFGMLMYFSTLTEIPILESFTGLGMGQGPALSLLLAGPALSLPNLLSIRNVLGTKKTAVYAGLVVVMATIAGMLFGTIVS
ncbi:permease [Proteinivorax hydrogeniformans]|uniref:Permease n=1 Tax=Proteinivorax hydrogeniformans TaxID=1826727 RepID=A0AAU8HWH3_9FIRM